MNLSTLRYCVLISLFILIGERVVSQATDKNDIIGTWISEEDTNWKIVFTKDHTCDQYYTDSIIEKDTYVISNTSPQCGLEVEVAEHTSYLTLTDTATGDKICYEMNGISEKKLSLRVIGLGGAIVFTREAAKADKNNFNGDWYYDGGSCDLSLSITQVNSSISGRICAFSDGGNFIDCDDSDIPSSLSGSVRSDSALVTFTSTYCGKRGKAVIKRLSSNQISWRITKKPDGLYYFPDNAILTLE